MWNIAGVNGKNDSASLLWVTNHAFQSPRSGETAVYIEKKNTISSDVIVVRRLAATGSSFLSTGERKVCGGVGRSRWADAVRFWDEPSRFWEGFHCGDAYFDSCRTDGRQRYCRAVTSK